MISRLPVGLRHKRMAVRVVVHTPVIAFLLVVTAVASALEAMGIAAFFGLALVAYVLTLRLNPLPAQLEQRLLQVVECEVCGTVFGLSGNWGCGCGFQSWNPRHAFTRCPHCHKTFEWLNCPSCQNGVLL